MASRIGGSGGSQAAHPVHIAHAAGGDALLHASAVTRAAATHRRRPPAAAVAPRQQLQAIAPPSVSPPRGRLPVMRPSRKTASSSPRCTRRRTVEALTPSRSAASATRISVAQRPKRPPFRHDRGVRLPLCVVRDPAPLERRRGLALAGGHGAAAGTDPMASRIAPVTSDARLTAARLTRSPRPLMPACQFVLPLPRHQCRHRHGRPSPRTTAATCSAIGSSTPCWAARSGRREPCSRPRRPRELGGRIGPGQAGAHQLAGAPVARQRTHAGRDQVPDPGQPAKVNGCAPAATPRRVISARPRVMMPPWPSRRRRAHPPCRQPAPPRSSARRTAPRPRRPDWCRRGTDLTPVAGHLARQRGILRGNHAAGRLAGGDFARQVWPG